MEKTLLANFKTVLKRYRGEFLKGLGMVIVSNTLLIINPLVFRQAIYALDPQETPEPGLLRSFLQWALGSASSHLLVWAFLLLSIAAVASLFKYFMRLTFISVSREVEQEVREKIFRRIQMQSMAFFDRHGIGELLSRLTNDISTYRDMLGPGIMYPIFFATLVFPGLIALFTLSRPLAFVSLIPLLMIPLFNSLVRKQIYTLSRIVQKCLADMSSKVQEHFSGIRMIRSYTAEKAIRGSFETLCQAFKQLQIKLTCYQGLLFPFFTLMAKTTSVILVLFFGIVVFQQWGELSGADFISFMWIQSYIFFPVLMLAWVLPIYERGRAAYDRLVEIYEEPIEVQDQAQVPLRIPEKASIQLHNLNFSYPGSKFSTLKNISLKVQGGSFTGITGPIGSGKTTLFRLLNREYEIPEGVITIGDNDIHAYPLNAFHQAVVTVEQIPFLFSKSIAENVRFGRQEATQSELELVAQYADLHETILEFPEQYETLIGERGVTLSGGQKSRVAMARAFLVNRSILLLDDIFSAVDVATEQQIFDAMKKNFSGKTVLLITHRASILEKMDHVVYMKEGEIVEEGTPQQLRTRNQHYAALTQLQAVNGGDA